jgi:hypothetical protein
VPYDRILDLMSPPGQSRLYVLGAYARRVTIYSQQVRAINLVDAIDRYRGGLNGRRVAIVGGGIAGLTAAARALDYGAKVSVFEQTEQLISLQNDASHRWVHPHLYEWPAESARRLLEDKAGLPVLDWSAQKANDLAKDLRGQWNNIAQARAGMLSQHTLAKVTRIDLGLQACELTFNDLRTKTIATASFDLAILALGYGLEPDDHGKDSYWRLDGGPGFLARPKEECVLVAGYGDGALTDLMRACLKEFDHGEILKEIIGALAPADIDIVRGLESGITSEDADLLTERYEELDLPAVRSILKSRRVESRKVVLTGLGEHLFDPAASTLNRVILSQLLREGAFHHVPLAGGEKIKRADNEDPAVARILSKLKARDAGIPEFTTFVLRFGTQRILPAGANEPLAADVGGVPIIEGLPQSMRVLRKAWEELSPEDDPTRRPLWPLMEPVLKSVQAMKALRPSPEAADHYCLTVEPGGRRAGQPWLHHRVREACNQLRRGQKLNFEFEQVALSADNCVGSREAIAFTTRLLCRAPIAVFNLGGKLGADSPALMMLLGIRAAVRRGLTLVIVDDKPDWSELPFNIKELQVLPLDPEKDREKLTTVLASGWSGLQQKSRTYRDMPVFDTVRQFERRTMGSPTDKTEVFALCSFRPEYLAKTFSDLRSLVGGASGDDEYDLRPVNEYLSPMLASEKIYDLARFSRRCLVDWTDWKANVFFELGVRLAVNLIPPLCVIKKGEQEADNASANLLAALSPIVYDSDDIREGSGFSDTFRKAEQELNLKSTVNHVYRTAERHAAVKHEMGSSPFAHELVGQIREMIGDVEQRGGLFFLYDQNPALWEQVWTSLVDRLTAADMLLASKLSKESKISPDEQKRLIEDHDYVCVTLDRLKELGRERGYDVPRIRVRDAG